MSEKNIKKILEDNDKDATYTVREISSSSSGKSYKVTKNDNSGDGAFFLGILVLLLYIIAAPYFIYKYVKRKKRESRGNFLEEDRSVKKTEEDNTIPITNKLKNENELNDLYTEVKKFIQEKEFLTAKTLENNFDIEHLEATNILKQLQNDKLISLEKEGDNGYIVYKEDTVLISDEDTRHVHANNSRDGIDGPIYRPKFDDFIFAIMVKDTCERKYYYIYDSAIINYPKEIVCTYIKKYYSIRKFKDAGIAKCISSDSPFAKLLLDMKPDQMFKFNDKKCFIYRKGKIKRTLHETINEPHAPHKIIKKN